MWVYHWQGRKQNKSDYNIFLWNAIKIKSSFFLREKAVSVCIYIYTLNKCMLFVQYTDSEIGRKCFRWNCYTLNSTLFTFIKMKAMHNTYYISLYLLYILNEKRLFLNKLLVKSISKAVKVMLMIPFLKALLVLLVLGMVNKGSELNLNSFLPILSIFLSKIA